MENINFPAAIGIYIQQFYCMSAHIIRHSCQRGIAELVFLFHDKHLLSSQHKLFLLQPLTSPSGQVDTEQRLLNRVQKL